MGNSKTARQIKVVYILKQSPPIPAKTKNGSSARHLSPFMSQVMLRLVENSVCFRAKDQMLQSLKASWGLLTSLFENHANDEYLETERRAHTRTMKRNRSSFCLNESSSVHKMSSAKRGDTFCAAPSAPDAEAPILRSPILLPTLPRTDALIMTAPNSAQIREELQRFARIQQDAKDTKYNINVKERMAEFNNRLTDSCMS